MGEPIIGLQHDGYGGNLRPQNVLLWAQRAQTGMADIQGPCTIDADVLRNIFQALEVLAKAAGATSDQAYADSLSRSGGQGWR